MCRPASFVLTKEKAYWSMRTDSHEEIIKEYNLRESFGHIYNIQILRVEVVPRNGDLLSDVSDWEFIADQDLRPDWFDAERDENRSRAAAKEWQSCRVFREGVHQIRDAQVWLYGNSQATLYGNSQATLRENSQATLYGNSQATLRENSQATLYGNSQATLRENSQATLYGNSQATLYGNSQATLYGNSQATLRENSQAKARGQTTLNNWTGKNSDLSEKAVEIMRKLNKAPDIYISKG